MKKAILILAVFIMLFSNNSRSQNWAPDGAEWHYNYVNFYYMGYIHINVVGDTLISGTPCRILNKTAVIHNYELDTTWTRIIGREYMYSDEDRVYIYANDQFYTLYDFSASIGDSWVIPANMDLLDWCASEGEIIVTDTGTVSVNGQELRTIAVDATINSEWIIFGQIIERIGPVSSYMIPEPSGLCVIDLFEGGNLRCYYDDAFGLYSTIGPEQCDYIVSVSEQVEPQVEIFPNPSTAFINIRIPDLTSKDRIEIFDISGKLVKEEKPVEKSSCIDVSDLKSGIYSARIISGKTMINRVIIVNN